MIDAPHITDIQDSFAAALPKIQGLAGAHHRRLRGGEKEEAVAETVALAWKAYRDLALRGRDVVRLLGRIVEFSAKKVRCGLGLTNVNPIRDIMSDRARFRHQYRLDSLPLADEETGPEIADALRYESSPADLAVLNADYEAWLDELDGYRRDVAEKLASGLNTADVARTRGVSRARIAQIRVQLIGEWERFNGQRR